MILASISKQLVNTHLTTGHPSTSIWNTKSAKSLLRPIHETIDSVFEFVIDSGIDFVIDSAIDYITVSIQAKPGKTTILRSFQ